MARTHTYEVSVAWTGNRGTGTSGYRAYGRRVTVSAESMTDAAMRLHEEASARCFIAGFPVRHEPVVTAGASDTVRYAASHQGRRSDP